MADSTLPVPSDDKSSLRERVGRTRDAFSLALKQGRAPRIEDFLSGIAPDEAEQFLQEMLALEIELLRQAGREVDREDYLRRFPQHAECIQRAFAQFDGAGLLNETAAYIPVSDAGSNDGNISGQTMEAAYSLPLSQLEKIDQVCDEFETAWRSGAQPKIEEHLKRLPESLQEEGLRRLVELEIHCLRQAGRSPRVEEYRTRFSALTKAVDAAFRLSSSHGRGSEDGLSHPTLPSGADEIPALPSGPAAFRFRRLRRHARGGLGEVWLAVDGELNREVALKEILAKHNKNGEIQRRFLVEAEITGGLEHPNVAPVYSLGQYPDGRPYYAMRFIRGESLKNTIARLHGGDGNGRQGRHDPLELRKVLTRFVAVCDALHYAHSRGVIHRDLKPDNIMLGPFGETFVVDWGLAKTGTESTESSLSDLTPIRPASGSGSAPTIVGSVIGTPSFMSPEQAKGLADQTGPPADIYGLGATLYCVLTGKAPIPSGSLNEMLRRVQTGEVAPVRAVNSRIAKPLEAICHKAMAVQPGDRYETARHLADDIERWLADEPVLAYRENAWERSLRWVRRHRSWAAAAAAALVLVTIVSTAAFFLVDQARRDQARLARENRQLAEEEQLARQEAQRRGDEAVRRLRLAREAVDTWLTTAASELRYVAGVQPTRDRLLAKAEQTYSRLATETSDDADLALELARSRLRLGDIRAMLGDSQGAGQAYLDADELLTRLGRRHPNRDDISIVLAKCHTKLGLWRAGRDEAPEALEHYRSALEIAQKLLVKEQPDVAAKRSLAEALVNRGQLRTLTGELDQAEEDLTLAIQTYRDLEGSSTSAAASPGMATARLLLGSVLAARGQNEDALQTIERALDSFDALVEDEPRNSDRRNSRAEALVFLAGVERSAGDHQRELELYERSLNDYYQLVDAPRDVPAFRVNYALARLDYSQLLYQLGRIAKAEQEQRQTQQEIAALTEIYPDDALARELSATIIDMLGQTRRELGQYEQARDDHLAAVQAFEALTETAPQQVGYVHRLAICRSHLAQALADLGEVELSEDAFAASLAVLEELQSLAPDVPDYQNDAAWVWRRLGDARHAQGKVGQARQAWQKAAAKWEQVTTKWPTPQYQKDYAWLLVGCVDEELRQIEKGLDLARRARDATPASALFWSVLAAAQCRAGEWDASIASFGESASRLSPPEARDLFYLAMAHAGRGEKDKAKEMFDRAVDRMAQTRPGNRNLAQLKQEAQEVIEGL